MRSSGNSEAQLWRRGAAASLSEAAQRSSGAGGGKPPRGTRPSHAAAAQRSYVARGRPLLPPCKAPPSQQRPAYGRQKAVPRSTLT